MDDKRCDEMLFTGPRLGMPFSIAFSDMPDRSKGLPALGFAAIRNAQNSRRFAGQAHTIVQLGSFNGYQVAHSKHGHQVAHAKQDLPATIAEFAN
jgi:hypothetical protein